MRLKNENSWCGDGIGQDGHVCLAFSSHPIGHINDMFSSSFARFRLLTASITQKNDLDISNEILCSTQPNIFRTHRRE